MSRQPYRKFTLKKYLICSRDESVVYFKPYCVAAESAEGALEKFLKIVYSRDKVFRDDVLDLGVNMSFVERFYLSSTHEQERFDAAGTMGTEEEIVKSRVRVFFAPRPDLGDQFLRYMETTDQSLIGDDVFAFIAASTSDDEHGFVIIDIDSFDVVV